MDFAAGPCGGFVLIKPCHRKQIKDGQILPDEQQPCAKTGVPIRLFIQGDARPLAKACVVRGAGEELKPRAGQWPNVVFESF